MVCRILVADDSATIQKVIRIGLAAIQADIKSAGSLIEAMKAIEHGTFDLIIADAGLPGISTAGNFVKLSERAGNLPLIVLMGSYEAVRESDLRSVGINHIIKKPFPPSELPQLVQTLTGAQKAPPAPTPETHNISSIPSMPSSIGIPSIPVAASEAIVPAFLLGDESSPAMGETPFRLSSSVTSLPSHSVGDGQSLGGFPPVPDVEPSRKGRPAFDPGAVEPLGARSGQTSSSSMAGSQVKQNDFVPQPHTTAGLSAAVEVFVRDELPALVDRAVERYCVENFKGVAREVLTAELRRLAEEKARYLVDQ